MCMPFDLRRKSYHSHMLFEVHKNVIARTKLINLVALLIVLANHDNKYLMATLTQAIP